ncbi:mersacidin/lichenicidin family type 2 lantibiotic [Micromonospora sp. NPDC003197]|uniref:Mersacidin/lichenicidin family type 2 lantibiotic n=1 Tax=Micromonospora polyrhachis TaxID=1282883 RepID=A0A7W7WMK9_9ACTN|nr:mersacidin/lichenicidin family type 2 lantibiotic [Micromonospora polyrhachis]MBB4956569.1 mersacidin/lichenicidin family type 2 lantibiotic [Micromonospora polyrhachis]
MPTTDVVRAWTDTDYRATLSADQLAQLPAHPAGDLNAELAELVEMYEACSTYMTPCNTGPASTGPACCAC